MSNTRTPRGAGRACSNAARRSTRGVAADESSWAPAWFSSWVTNSGRCAPCGHRAFDPHARSVATGAEQAADAFGLELLRRIGDVPVGVMPVFQVFASLGPLEGDKDVEATRAATTHPLSSARLEAAAAFIRDNAASFTRTGTPAATVDVIGSELRRLAKLMDDRGLQRMLRQRGPGPPCRPSRARYTRAWAPGLSFAGSSRGRWVDHKGAGVDARMQLRRTGDRVQGEYDFGGGPGVDHRRRRRQPASLRVALGQRSLRPRRHASRRIGREFVRRLGLYRA